MWLINASIPCRKKCLISCLFKITCSSIFKGKPACDKYENSHRGTVKHACLYYTFKGKLQKNPTRFLLHVFTKRQQTLLNLKIKAGFLVHRKCRRKSEFTIVLSATQKNKLPPPTLLLLPRNCSGLMTPLLTAQWILPSCH